MSEVKACPIETLECLLDWEEGRRACDEQSRATTLLRLSENNPGPKLLVCHDMKGGYGDDSLLQGGHDPDQYGVYHWYLIDIFVYFSHHFITIPPPAWTNCCHLHGVKSLGTIITEWDGGKEVCKAMFASEQQAELAARQLTRIAQYFRFEGWLINIENDLPEHLIPNLIHFIRTLHRLMHGMSADAEVIWYDAVTVEGKLKWQNTLNGLNQPFFDACDGIFTNYHWKASTPAKAAARAGERKGAVYMGCDVFGRGTFGGGGFNSNIAMEAAFPQGLSLAIFAPGWVFETAEEGAAWRERNHRFWDHLQKTGCKFGPPRPLICSLPFQSCFSQGCGLANYDEGQRVSEQAWFNLSHQTTQPLCQDELVMSIALQTGNFLSDLRTPTANAAMEQPASRQDSSANSPAALAPGIGLAHQSSARDRRRLNEENKGGDSIIGHDRVGLSIQWLHARLKMGEAFSKGTVLCIDGKMQQGSMCCIPLFAMEFQEETGPLRCRLTIAQHTGFCQLQPILREYSDCEYSEKNFKSAFRGSLDQNAEESLELRKTTVQTVSSKRWAQTDTRLTKVKGNTLMLLCLNVSAAGDSEHFSCSLGDILLDQSFGHEDGVSLTPLEGSAE